MGVHISVRKITGKTMEKLWNNKEIPYYTVECQEWWDTIRHSGDREFILENEFTAVDTDNEVEEQEYFRPTNFEKSINWVNETQLPESNKQRLLTALNRMKDDETLCFSWSW